MLGTSRDGKDTADAELHCNEANVMMGEPRPIINRGFSSFHQRLISIHETSNCAVCGGIQTPFQTQQDIGTVALERRNRQGIEELAAVGSAGRSAGALCWCFTPSRSAPEGTPRHERSHRQSWGGEIKRPSRILETRQPITENGSTKSVADGMEASLPYRKEERVQSGKVIESRPPEGRLHNQPPIVQEQAPETMAASASTPIPSAMPFSTGSNRKLSKSVALRRARMKGLEFQDRWKCDLLRQSRRLMRRLGN